ncbi:MAG: hypothetical protein HY998_05205 [candidate division NC10 bacterium]|nr:hypothetical protein [candidate division NC10 bacterium]
MLQIIDKYVPLNIPREGTFSVILAQLPNKLKFQRYLYNLIDPREKWSLVKSVLEKIASGEDRFEKAQFVAFPEAAIPFKYKDEVLKLIQDRFPSNTVTIMGFEHIFFRQYWELLAEYRSVNSEAYELILKEDFRGEENQPVNWCLVVVKDNEGRLHPFLEAKTHPFFGEEFLDHPHDLYRGRHIYLFRSSLVPFNFIVLICLDYIYRDIHGSNVTAIIQRANRMYYQERQQLDLLFVIQCNPKPEHKVFKDVVSGFYGERLIFMPGVKNATTLFLNSSGETEVEGLPAEDAGFGHSSVVFHKNRRLPLTSVAEYRTDDFYGEPVSRLRFGRDTRLYFLELALFPERDPRTSRIPVKILSIWCQEEGKWRALEGEEIISGIRPLGDLEEL